MKKIISLALAFVLTFGLCAVASAQDDIPEGYTPVYTAEDLDNIRNNLSGKYILMNDIDLSAYENWEPIGTADAPFTGKFDGNNYVINNISINIAKSNVGLFGYLNSSEISNLTLENAKVEINTEENISVGLISGQAVDSVLSNCKSNGTINVESEGNVFVGGIVGKIWRNSKSSGDCYVSNCSNDTDISVTGKSNGSTKTKDLHIGGIAGYSYVTVSRCSNEGAVNLSNFDSTSVFADAAAGGICGCTRGKIEDCYNLGSIKSVGTDFAFAGGIVGYWMSENSISNLYNTGEVNSLSTEEDSLVFCGALIGYEEGTVIIDGDSEEHNIFLSNCYYSDNNSAANGFLGSCTVINVKMLSNEDFRIQSSFEGFDFENVWEMSEEYERPVLRSKNTSEPEGNKILEWFYGIWERIINCFNNISRKIFGFINL